mmetsp:Transcript_22225/g.19056  ORF Transcript_22225/g.19056 Transcript_22225/m.19056 type:complete len:175 (+) Transcript_22225:1970-2494(+)
MLRELLEFARTSISELQTRVTQSKGNPRDSARLEKQVNELKLENAKLKGEIQEQMIEMKRKMEKEYDDKMSQMVEDKKAESMRNENSLRELVSALENQVAALKQVDHDKNESDSMIQSLKNEVKSQEEQIKALRGFNTNYQTIHDNQHSEIRKLKLEIEELKIKLEDARKAAKN